MSRRWLALAGLGLGLACGPGTGSPQMPSEGTGTDTGTNATTSGANTSGTSGTVEPTTSGGPLSDDTTTGEFASDEGYEDDDGGDGCSFTCPPPPPPPPQPGGGGGIFECDIFAQDCAEGDKCMPSSGGGGSPQWETTRCTPIADEPGQPGDPCLVEDNPTSGIDDCDLGVVCVVTEPATNEGTCEPLCTGDRANPICEDPDDECVFVLGLFPLCQNACEPVMPDCGPGDGCYIVNEEFTCLPVPAMPALAGDPCAGPTTCDAGLMCAFGAAFDCGGAPGEGCCTPVCDANDPGSCAGPAQTCAPWLPAPAPPEYAHIGVCEPAP